MGLGGMESAGQPDRIPTIDRLSYGTGILADNLTKQTAQQMVVPFYNLYLGVNPALLGLMLATVRLCETGSDLLIGHLSDHSRSRLGRRRPFMAVGTVALAAFFFLLWWPAASWPPAGVVAFCFVALILHGAAHSVFSVPYASLGFELTADYHERTRLMAMQALLAPLASLLSVWAFALVQWPGFGGIEVGAWWLAGGIALATLACGLWPVWALRERRHVPTAPQSRANLRTSLRACSHCRPNLLLCGAVFSLLVGALTAEGLRLYVCIFHVCSGDKQTGAILTGLLGTAYQAASIIAVPFITRWSIRVGKSRALRHCLAIGAGGAALQWWAYDPRFPYLALVPNVVMGAGLAGMWLLAPSMLADIAGQDAAATGVRREGMFAAFWSGTMKLAVTLAVLLSGLFLDLSGFDAARGATQAPAALWRLHVVLAWLPAFTLSLSWWFIRRLARDEAALRRSDLQ